jgi:hypothetical protein
VWILGEARPLPLSFYCCRRVAANTLAVTSREAGVRAPPFAAAGVDGKAAGDGAPSQDDNNRTRMSRRSVLIGAYKSSKQTERPLRFR